MTAYKVIVRNSPNWRSFDATTLGVSVNSPNWQDEKLASILDFACVNFDTIRIDVTDALYRHGFMASGMDAEAALSHANALGSMWLAKHADLLHTMSVKPTIVRWAEWYKHPDYEQTLAGFRYAYANSEILRKAIHQDIMDFYSRRGRQPTPEEYQGSKDYFIEELAVITLQARELPSLKIYPGDELKSLFVVRHKLVPEAPSGLENEQFAKIKFAPRHKQPAPIYFTEKLEVA